MKRTLRTLTIVICLAPSLRAADGQHADGPTFTKDVAPILQKNCQSCHRPGEAGPFSMLTYEETASLDGGDRLAVQQKIMPPWYADPQFGHFSNTRSQRQEIKTIVAWVIAGAPKGDPKDMPPPLKFVEGWGIPKPDVVFQLPKPFPVPESGMVEYQYVIVPTGFTKDTWVQAAEVRPPSVPWSTTSSPTCASQDRTTSRIRSRSIFRSVPGEDGRESRHQRAAQRFSGRLCSRSAGGNSAAGAGETDQGGFGHRVRGPLHAQRQSR